MAQVGVDYTSKKVIVGLTGRVSSCVAALLLKKQGMNVIGVSIVTNSNDSFSENSAFPKCHISDLDKVKDFCDSLKIPFYATDAKSEYESDVIDPLISNKLSGQANTSCFNCTHMRIKILFQKMIKLNADYIATGHFCKVHKNLNSEEYFIHSNNDADSDQSFLLAGLNSEYLKHLLLPLGELKSEEVEKIAKKFNLNTAEKSTIEGFCFQDKDSYFDLALSKVPKSLIKEGQVQNVDTDVYLGDHEGILGYSITEKELNFKGVVTADKDLEIVSYDFVKAVIGVGSRENLTHKGFQIVKLKLGSGLDTTRPMLCYMKNKYSQDYIKCNLFFKNNNTALIECSDEIYPLIFGEYFVIFDRNTRNAKVIGLGTVGNIGDFTLIDRVKNFRSSENEGDENQKYIYSNTFKF
jgi:tRNA-specific 2-thiouridylase